MVDVNPRPAISIVGIAKVMRGGAGGPDPQGASFDAAGEGDGGGEVRVSEGRAEILDDKASA